MTSIWFTSIPKDIFSPKIHCAFFPFNPQHHLYLLTRQRQIYSVKSQRVKYSAQGHNTSSMDHNINPRGTILSPWILFVSFLIYFSRPNSSDIRNLQTHFISDNLFLSFFCHATVFTLTISSGLVIWPRPNISPGTLMRLEVMWLSLPSNKRLIYDMVL